MIHFHHSKNLNEFNWLIYLGYSYRTIFIFFFLNLISQVLSMSETGKIKEAYSFTSNRNISRRKRSPTIFSGAYWNCPLIPEKNLIFNIWSALGNRDKYKRCRRKFGLLDYDEKSLWEVVITNNEFSYILCCVIILIHVSEFS